MRKRLDYPQRDEHDFRWYSIDDIFQLFCQTLRFDVVFTDETLTTL
ncbi:MAG: hypothetical protein ACLSFJ_01035 [Holdemania filiformis]